MIENGYENDEFGTKRWFQNGELHREDGPAIEYANGDKNWYQNGDLHREEGPAIERANGYKVWYQDGKRHRDDGPAVEWASGDKVWYLEGKKLTFEEFFDRASDELKEDLFYNLDR